MSQARGRSPLLRFLRYVEPHKWYIIGAAVTGVFKFLIPLTFPLALKYLTDVVLAPSAPTSLHTTDRFIAAWCDLAQTFLPMLGNQRVGRVTIVCGTLFLLYAVLAVVSFYRSYWAGQAGHRLIFDLRYALYQHIQSMSHSFFDQRRSGAIVARFVSDIQLAQNFVGSALTNVWMDSAALVFIIWILFLLEHRLAWVALTVIPFYVGLIRYFRPRIKAATREVQETLEDFSGDLQERIAGAAIVKGFGREAHEAKRFQSTSRKLLDLTLRNVSLSSANMAATTWLTTTAPLVVIWAASTMIVRDELSVGTMIAFYAYLGSLYLPLQRFSELSVVISNSTAAIERIFELFDIRPEVAEAADAKDLAAARGHVTFADVSFTYASRSDRPPVLQHIDLDVAAGQTIALVGRSGAGKSTLVSLLPRFYDVVEGSLRIDGIDVRDLKLDSLRRQIGIVPQDPLLFTGTLQENLLYGNPDATEEEMYRASIAANAHEFVEQLPERYLTVVGERGVRLSGGQRQRIAIARAFLRNPVLLIFDEATSALDSESENLIHEALRRLMKGRTTFIIAHRLSTVMSADRIVVLEHGRIAEIGQHAELLSRNGAYAQLYDEQFSKMEIEARTSLRGGAADTGHPQTATQ